ncbi:hypothetical protein PCANC_09324 [Puccinia coronata f. sp. avenae]|uniref:Uncharacterized protein n=1 Tax=Puccinia coronata f. sp. avenae TaxID=200324 RepID=A0A2N5T5K3_9BASI|nr:hypothetical protein PCANC_09324 [Puccinia coronata f. sp. avenae]
MGNTRVLATTSTLFGNSRATQPTRQPGQHTTRCSQLEHPNHQTTPKLEKTKDEHQSRSALRLAQPDVGQDHKHVDRMSTTADTAELRTAHSNPKMRKIIKKQK